MNWINRRLAEIKRELFKLDWASSAHIYRVRWSEHLDASGEVVLGYEPDPEGTGDEALIKIIGKERRGDCVPMFSQILSLELIKDLPAEEVVAILRPTMEEKYQSLLEEGGEAEG